MNISILGSLLPIFVVILTGYLFRRFRFPGDAFWPYAERITYFVLFPALLLQKTASATLDIHTLGPMVLALLATVLFMASLLFLIRPWLSMSASSFTSFFQGGLRINTYVGLSAAFAIFGDTGITLAAVAIGVMIPLINVLCVAILVGSSKAESKNWSSLISGIVQNPLIIACAAGIAINISGVGLHTGISETLLIIGRASLPLGLMALGAGLDINAARNSGRLIILNCAIKLIIMPLCMFTAAQLMELDPVASAIAVLFAALPGSPNAYILARQLGGDSLLMANIVTVQVISSMITLPVVVALITL
jgi:predicted permease